MSSAYHRPKAKSPAIRKYKRLKSRAIVKKLFKSGKSIHNKPIKLVWDILPHPGSNIPSVAFSVPKSNWKKAVDRNLLKRRMSEAFRLSFSSVNLELPANKSLALFFVYTGTELAGFGEIQAKIILNLSRLSMAIGNDRENIQ